MDSQIIALIILVSLLVLLSSGLAVALCFMAINVVGVTLLWGGGKGLYLLSLSMWTSLASFQYLPIPMFIFLGEVLFRSGMAMKAVNVVDQWLGKLPGRLAVLVVILSTMFSALTGSTIATTAMLGRAVLPEMKKRGYSDEMSMGVICGTGGLAQIIPPSSMSVTWAALAEVSIAGILVAGILPGLLLAVIYFIYVIGRCWLQPSIAPAYEVIQVSMSKKIMDTVKYVVPLGLIVFMVTGVIFLGVAGPTEAACLGALAGIILTFFYKSFSWGLIRDSLFSTLKITSMIFIIMAGAQAFGQILSFTGVLKEGTNWVAVLPLPPIMVVVAMMMVLLIMGCFMSAMPMMMICIPIFMPIIQKLGYDPIWFGILFLLNIEIGQETPPFGYSLYTMKAVAPPGTTMWDVVKADLPFLFCDILVMFLVLFFPSLATWLPSLL